MDHKRAAPLEDTSRHSIRLPGRDYSRPGPYSVTICTHNKVCILGDIFKEKMYLNQLGKLVEEHWREIPDHLPYVKLLEYKVMPNHLHGVIIIKKEGRGVGLDTASRVATQLSQHEAFGKPTVGTLPTIIRSFKSGVSYEVNNLFKDSFSPLWQRGYHERVIRNKAELLAIIKYIRDNPKNWDKDPHNIHRKHS
jgi:putative transposase